MTIQESTKLFTVKELAQILNTKEGQVRKLVFYRKIPFIKVGGSVRFEKTAIEDWLKKNTVHATAS